MNGITTQQNDGNKKQKLQKHKKKHEMCDSVNDACISHLFVIIVVFFVCNGVKIKMNRYLKNQ